MDYAAVGSFIFIFLYPSFSFFFVIQLGGGDLKDLVFIVNGSLIIGLSKITFENYPFLS